MKNTSAKKKLYISSAILYLGVVGWLTISFLTEGHGSFWTCPTKLITHYPCPGCGTTRATMSILRGDVLAGIARNPNGLLAVAFLALYPIIVGIDLVWNKRNLWKIDRASDRWFRKWWVLVLIGLYLIFLIWNGIRVGN